MATPLLTLAGLSKFYTSAQSVVVGLNNVNLSFSRGEFVAITGESGSGKSTLAHVLGGILPYESGELYVDGRPTSHFDSKDWERYRRDKISFISQNYGILLSATVLENVVSALRLSGMDVKEAKAEARKILEKVELLQLRSRRAAKLSSGQKQRLAIARALAKPASILIADEPTGNLDPENSAKVISLLAEAAKDRLVLLITHDFHEAEGYATRRISLQDGRVTTDAALQPQNQPENLPKTREKGKKPLSFYVSRLQLGGRPVWGSLVLLFFALTAFAVFAFLGTFIVALDDTNTRIYDPSAFRNGDATRIVVQRFDGDIMTQEDFDALLKMPYVQALEKHSLIRDVNCYYIPDVHYRSVYTLVADDELPPIYTEKERLELLDNSYFAQTVPLLPEGETFLTAGRLPENIWEVVMAGAPEEIGKTMRIYLSDRKSWAKETYIWLDVTVVGVTDYSTGIYLHDDIARPIDSGYGSVLLLPDQNVETGTCRFSQYRIFQWEPWDQETVPFTDLQGNQRPLKLGTPHEMTCIPAVLVSQEDFDAFIPAFYSKQVSLTISNYAYTDRALAAIQNAGYAAVSPYRLGATQQISQLVTERMQTLIICLAVLLVVVLLQVIVLRALFGSQMENYQLLANIGLSCKTAKASVFWQMVLFTVLGQALGAAALWLCYEKGVERIVSIIRYLPIPLMAVLSMVHLAASLIAGVWIAGAMQKRVYPSVALRDDLDMDEEAQV